MKRGSLLTVLALALFLAFLLYSTLSSQRAECTVTVAFHGAVQTATASAETAADAERQARTTACGTMAQGMNETIACTNTPPVRTSCHDT